MRWREQEKRRKQENSKLLNFMKLKKLLKICWSLMPRNVVHWEEQDKRRKQGNRKLLNILKLKKLLKLCRTILQKI